jgi:transposase
VRRLDAILGLLVQGGLTPGQKRTAESQTILLYKVGLRPFEIAKITGRHANNVRRDIAEARKSGLLPKRDVGGAEPPAE